MIIAGKPELGLQPHQQEAYSAVTEAHKTGNRAAVVIPTGCGKSFIALQLMEDNKDKNILFLAPTEPIRDQMYRYIAKYIVGEEPSKGRSAKKIAEEHFPNLKIMLYPALARAKKEVLENLNPDIIIMDELHRTGADTWGPRIDELLEMNPNAKILGLTATPDRMDDKNVIDNIFEGNISYELTLVEAMRRRILKSPQYVKCDYALGEELESIKAYIDSCDNPEQKKELEEKYNKMRSIVDRAKGIPELFEENIIKKDGKYIVFCKNMEHMKELIGDPEKKDGKIYEWFKNIDTEPEVYSVYAGYGKKKNQETIKQFETSKTEHIKLLFSVDMLNEGLHVEDISGVIMLRPTDSRIIYLQQLGRALSSDTSRQQTIIFDLVNNYLKNNLDREINGNKEAREKTEREQENNSDSENYEQEDIDIFRIQGEIKEFLSLLEETRGIIVRSGYLVNAIEIEKWSDGNSRLPSQEAKDEEERKLAKQLSNIRTWLKGEKESEGKEEVREIIERLDSKYNEKITKYGGEVRKLVQAREIENWSDENGRLPSSVAKDEEERKLAERLSDIRKWLKEEKEAKGKEEVREIIERIDAKYNEKVKKYVNEPVKLVQVREIEKWSDENGRLPNQSAEDEEERNLGKQLNGIRQWLKEEKEAKGKEEVREIIERLDSKYNEKITKYGGEVRKLVQAREIENWSDENGRLPSTHSKDEEERILGRQLSKIRDWLKDEKEAEGKEEVRKIIERLDAKYNERMKKYGNEVVKLVQARDIENWSEENGRLPSQHAKDEKERKLGDQLNKIRKWLKGEKKSEGKEEVREIIERLDAKYNERMKKYGNELVQLVQAKEIEKWSDENGKLPSKKAKDEEERKLGIQLSDIRTWLKSKKEVEGKEDVREIIERLDAKYNERLTRYGGEVRKLVQAREIENWTEENGRLPSITAKDEEERKLGIQLSNIRTWLKEEKEVEGKEEVREIIERVDAKYNEKLTRYGGEVRKLVQAREIENWSDENGRLPSERAKDEKERKLAQRLTDIRQWLKDGRAAEGKEEVREIIERLDAKYKKKRTVREMVQATIDAPVEECDRAARAVQELTQKKEVTHK